MGRPEACVLFAQTFVHPHLDEYVDEVRACCFVFVFSVPFLHFLLRLMGLAFFLSILGVIDFWLRRKKKENAAKRKKIKETNLCWVLGAGHKEEIIRLGSFLYFWKLGFG